MGDEDKNPSSRRASARLIEKRNNSTDRSRNGTPRQDKTQDRRLDDPAVIRGCDHGQGDVPPVPSQVAPSPIDAIDNIPDGGQMPIAHCSYGISGSGENNDHYKAHKNAGSPADTGNANLHNPSIRSGQSSDNMTSSSNSTTMHTTMAMASNIPTFHSRGEFVQWLEETLRQEREKEKDTEFASTVKESALRSHLFPPNLDLASTNTMNKTTGDTTNCGNPVTEIDLAVDKLPAVPFSAHLTGNDNHGQHILKTSTIQTNLQSSDKPRCPLLKDLNNFNNPLPRSNLSPIFNFSRNNTIEKPIQIESQSTDQVSDTLKIGMEIAKAITLGLQQQSNSAVSNSEMKQFLSRQTYCKEFTNFTGKPEEWPAFLRRFNQITESCGLSDTEQMDRLDKCLRGEARDAVASLLGFPENLSKVLETLRQTFGRPSQIIQAFTTKVHQLASPNENNPESIISYVNVVRNLVTTIEVVNMHGYLFNPQLLEELVMKLPQSYRTRWGFEVAEKKMIDNANLKDFSSWLDTVALAVSCLPSRSTKASTSGDHHAKQRNSRDTVLSVHEKKPSKETKSSCQCCSKSNHETKDCFKLTKADIDKRWEIIRSAKVCFCCFQKGHQTSNCPNKKECGVGGCTHIHHPLLHNPKATKKLNPDNTEKKVNPDDTSSTTAASTDPRSWCGNTWLKSTDACLLKILPVRLVGPSGSIKTYALLDDASTVTLIDERISSQLGLKGSEQPLSLQWTNETIHNEMSSKSVALEIEGVHENAKSYRITSARTVQNLALRSQSLNIDELRSHWPYLQDIPFSSLHHATPVILIGQNNPMLLSSFKSVHGAWNAPFASKTRLGWVVHGPATNLGKTSDVTYTIQQVYETDYVNDSLHQLVKDSFSTESFGVKVIHENPRSKEDKRSIEIMERTTKRIEGGFETGLLWRNSECHLPESKYQAMQRLLYTEKKAKRDPILAKAYKDTIDDMITKGYYRKLTAAEAAVRDKHMWYLPHFPVINPNKPGKVRPVFDAAAESHGYSLNDFFLTGKDLLLPLQSVIYNFRLKKIGFLGDIKEMFLRVFIREEDQHAQRFLWRDFDATKEPDIYVITRVLFGAACSPSLAQFVKNLNAKEFEKEYPDASKAIRLHTYMDDWLDSTDTEDEAKKLIKDVIHVYRQGNFEICNFICNSKEVMKSIPSNLRKKDLQEISIDTELPMERVLGLWWNPETDNFTFKLNFHKVKTEIIQGLVNPTKRDVLKLIMSVFDSLGIIAHFMIKARILLQEIWRSNLGWDDKLTDDLDLKWKRWIADLQKIPLIQIPRCYGSAFSTASSIQLHIFADASEKAFAAVAYFRYEKDFVVDTSFIVAKARVAPLKPLSIPRMELQAALLASRLSASIKSEHKLQINSTHFWIDARNVLCWLRADARQFKQFVGHRVGEIEELTDVKDWHWVSTHDNVADDATRDNLETSFESTNRWWKGPEFLRKDPSFWPKEPENFTSSAKPEDLELKAEYCNVIVEKRPSLPDILRFSSWRKLIRCTAFYFRAIKKFLSKIRKDKMIFPKALTVQEIDNAEIAWIKEVQACYFSTEISQIKSLKPIKTNSSIYRLNPRLNNGVMRTQGRLENSSLAFNAKQPSILHPRHSYTRLLIKEYHERFNHQGTETIINELRQRHWILTLRSTVKSEIYKCLVCRRRKVKPEQPLMGQLPACRVTPQVRAFVFVGLDYFGPLKVKVKKSTEKRYGVIFVCMTTRAVHLELTDSLSTDSCILVFRRFVSRRGNPKEIYSDNGRNLRGAEIELKEAVKSIDYSKIQQHQIMQKVQWLFNPPAAPHFGGSWERLIQCVKKSLQVALKERIPREQVLMTLLTEAENIVNSRPLTLVSNDHCEPESLTPNCFLIGSSSSALSPGVFLDKDLKLRKQWRMAQRLSDYFWARFVKEYVPSLNERTKWFKNCSNVKIGVIVLLVDSNGPRNYWPLGRIENVYPGKDGVTRVVDVRTKDGVYRRAVTKLCVLKLDEDTS